MQLVFAHGTGSLSDMLILASSSWDCGCFAGIEEYCNQYKNTFLPLLQGRFNFLLAQQMASAQKGEYCSCYSSASAQLIFWFQLIFIFQLSL